MIRMVFAIDENNIIGASQPDINEARFKVLPPALKEVMENLYKSDHIAVGANSVGPFLRDPSQKVYVISRRPRKFEAPHIISVQDISELVEKYKNLSEELLVVGGLTVFKIFMEFTDKLDVALLNKPVDGDLILDNWPPQHLKLASETQWPGGKTIHFR